jgi:hypothetical protein
MTTDFGKDSLCVNALYSGRFATGTRLVAQRLYHALTTPRGSLRGSEAHLSWGDDLTELVGANGGRDTEAAIRAKVSRAAGLDDQIRSVETTIVSSQNSMGAHTHEVTVVGTTATGPFRLVLAISEVTVELIGMSA